MLTNFHTHTTFCDGKNTAEEMVLAALEKGFTALGFSGHGTTPEDLSYCMRDMDGYIAEVKRLQEKYKKDIRIYLGVEEDCWAPVDRSRFEYVIGSSHYLHAGGKRYDADHNVDTLKQAIAAFGGDRLALAEHYFDTFCTYLEQRKPDIVGHFDLLTKFDEGEESFFLRDPAYMALARGFIRRAAQSGCVFEVNTGAMARGLRTSPYPCDELLYELKKCDARLILSSDSHSADTLDFAFEEVREMLMDIGFVKLATLTDNGFMEYAI